jgi:hypothetical protein
MIHKLGPEDRPTVVNCINASTTHRQADQPTDIESSTLASEQTIFRQELVASELNREAHLNDGRRIAHLKEIAKAEGENPAFGYFARIIEQFHSAAAIPSDRPLSESDQRRIDLFLSERGVSSTHLTLEELYAILARLSVINAELDSLSPQEQSADQTVKVTVLNHERTALRAQLVNDSRETPKTVVVGQCQLHRPDHIERS